MLLQICACYSLWLNSTDPLARSLSQTQGWVLSGDRESSNRKTIAGASGGFQQAITTHTYFPAQLQLLAQNGWAPLMCCAPMLPEQLKVSGALAFTSLAARELLKQDTYLLFSPYLSFGISALRRERMVAHVELLSEVPVTCILDPVGKRKGFQDHLTRSHHRHWRGKKVHSCFLFAMLLRKAMLQWTIS